MLFDFLIGTFFIALGISMILKIFFNIKAPIVKPFIAGLLILLGAQIITNSFFYKQVYVTFNY